MADVADLPDSLECMACKAFKKDGLLKKIVKNKGKTVVFVCGTCKATATADDIAALPKNLQEDESAEAKALAADIEAADKALEEKRAEIAAAEARSKANKEKLAQLQLKSSSGNSGAGKDEKKESEDGATGKSTNTSSSSASSSSSAKAIDLVSDRSILQDDELAAEFGLALESFVDKPSDAKKKADAAVVKLAELGLMLIPASAAELLAGSK